MTTQQDYQSRGERELIERIIELETKIKSAKIRIKDEIEQNDTLDDILTILK